MKSLLIMSLAFLAAPWVQAQQMRVKTVDDGTVTFDVKSVNRIVFSDDDTLIPPRATTFLKISGNLKANTGPFFSQSEPWSIQDVDGNIVEIYISYTKTNADMWSWTMTDLTNGGVIETGMLEINNDGEIVMSQTTGGLVQVHYTFPYDGNVPVTLDLPPTTVNVFSDPDSFVYVVSNNGTASAYKCSYTPDTYNVTTTVYDESGTDHELTLRFERIIPRPYEYDTWSWAVWLATDVYPGSSFSSVNGLVGFQGNGTIEFTGTAFRAVETFNMVEIAPNSTAAIIRIVLDLSGWKQYSTAYATDEVVQDGYGAY